MCRYFCILRNYRLAGMCLFHHPVDLNLDTAASVFLYCVVQSSSTIVTYIIKVISASCS